MYILVFTFNQHHLTSFFRRHAAPWSWGKFVDLLSHIWPVILIAGLGGVARNMRVMRGNLLDVLNAQYVTTAVLQGPQRDHRAQRATPCPMRCIP
ncbi:MAG: hypothetical protein R2838_10685 [Caldilineaceae bacterium]